MVGVISYMTNNRFINMRLPGHGTQSNLAIFLGVFARLQEGRSRKGARFAKGRYLYLILFKVINTD